jgi:hypothetical protein
MSALPPIAVIDDDVQLRRSGIRTLAKWKLSRSGIITGAPTPPPLVLVDLFTDLAEAYGLGPTPNLPPAGCAIVGEVA